MVSIREGALLLIVGCGFVLVMELAEKLVFALAVPLAALSLIGFHAALFSVVAPHRLGIKKDKAYRLHPRRTHIGVPLLVATAGIGFGISAALS